MKLRRVLFGVYCVVCASALTWPLYDVAGNRVEPFVLGVPFNLAWNVGWILLTSAVLLAYHVTRKRG